MKEIYVDHSATTYVKDTVLDEMLPYYSINFGNASSQYSIGRESKKAINIARHRVSEAINCGVDEIYFTASGSEADNLVIKGIMNANKHRGNHIITSKIEHPAVLNSCRSLEKQGFRVTYLDVDDKGFVRLNELEDAITDCTVMVSIMAANNEIGTIQEIKEISKIAKEKNVIFHTDAVQAIGNMYIDVEELEIDALSMSAHKFYGPKGVGAAYIKRNIKFNPVIDGGHQENGKRAGTENVPAIVGMGKAIELSNIELEKYNDKLTKLRDYTINRIMHEIPNVKLNGDVKKRLAGNINVSFEGIEGEALLLMLDMKGICASSSSACTSGNSNPSYVLKAIGLEDSISKGTLRISYGERNTLEEAMIIVDTLKDVIRELRSIK